MLRVVWLVETTKAHFDGGFFKNRISFFIPFIYRVLFIYKSCKMVSLQGNSFRRFIMWGRVTFHLMDDPFRVGLIQRYPHEVTSHKAYEASLVRVLAMAIHRVYKALISQLYYLYRGLLYTKAVKDRHKEIRETSLVRESPILS